MAMLYVVLTSDVPRVLLIDEPQSFLHPGAIRKLFEIFSHHPQHQYIVTSHSPVAVSAADPSTILIVRKHEMQSSIELVDAHQADSIRSMLLELGARLSDVFGADNILWVEGATEERSFPAIVQGILGRMLLGTEILGILHTGDFETREADRAFEIYRRLSAGRGLLPPAIGFIFDRELRNEQQLTDLMRASGGKVQFLKRRMYENYLLSPRAIAAVMAQLPDFRTEPASVDDVQTWISDNKWDRGYFGRTVAAGDRTEELWLRDVDGAKLLRNLFNAIADTPYPYDKVEHGFALTRWLVDKDPSELHEIAETLRIQLDRSPDS